MPATPKKQTGRTNIAEIRPTGEALVFGVVYKATRFRYLFDGGDVCDVIAVQDDSDLRRAVLDATKHDGIVGCTIVEHDDDGDGISFYGGPI